MIYKIMLRIFLVILFSVFSTAATAQLIVIGSGKPQACYEYAQRGNQGSISAISTCRDALNAPLTVKDEAATLVNLGLLLMRKGDLEAAEKHYLSALNLQPETTEIHINYGAALIMMDRDKEALSYLNKAILLDTPKMKEALYNRAVVYHGKEDYRSAYFDLQSILKISPGYAPALKFIETYDVKRAG